MQNYHKSQYQVLVIELAKTTINQSIIQLLKVGQQSISNPRSLFLSEEVCNDDCQ